MTAKDWMRAAAEEIAKLWPQRDHGRGDGYLTDEQRSSIATSLRTVIERHCPLQRDVAYMPVPRCETCSHWEHTSVTNYGRCLQLGIGSMRDFGCVRWEEK